VANVDRVGDAAAAKSRTHVHAIPEPTNGVWTAAELTALRPYALITTGRIRRRYDSFSDGYDFQADGVLLCTLVANVRIPDENEAAQIVENNIGGVIDDLCDLAGARVI
jgi:hypothetical protein